MQIVIVSCVALCVVICSSTGADLSRRFMFSTGYGGSSCQTSLAGCALRCPNGYMTGPTGCYYCACASSGPSGSSGPMSGPMSGPQGMSNPFSGGYQSGTNPGGNPSQQQQQHQLAHPQCLTSASDCPCKVVPMHVSYPCYYCDCSGTNASVPTTPSLMTAALKVTSTPKPTPTPKLMTPSPIQTTPSSGIVLTTRGTPVNVTSGGDHCAIAAQLCEMGCKGGYLVDAADCTYCVCKSELGTHY